jgi:hypothetical protein
MWLAHTINPLGYASAKFQRRSWILPVFGQNRTKEGFMQAYEDNTQRVLGTVAKENLVVFQAVDGWGPLVKALGVPEPNTAYPALNDAREMQMVVHAFQFMGFATLLLYLVLFFCGFRFVSRKCGGSVDKAKKDL